MAFFFVNLKQPYFSFERGALQFFLGKAGVFTPEVNR